MSRYEAARFRITPWPGVRLPHPPLLFSGRPYRLVDGVLVPDMSAAGKQRRRSRGVGDPELVLSVEEIYLELAAVNLDDERAIVDFASRFRTLGVRHGHFAAFEHFPGFELIRTQLEAAWPEQFTPGGLVLNEGIEDFRFGARCLRDLTTAWQIVSGQPPENPRWQSLPRGEGIFGASDLALYADHGQTPTAADEAVELLCRLLTPALAPFQPHILPGAWDKIEDHALPIANAPLYSICCLELYNHIVEHATYRRCANPSCCRVFSRHKGRAAAGQYRREGIIYCSSYCARAQAQRRYREKTKKRTRPPVSGDEAR
jgi:hypothetical protein